MLKKMSSRRLLKNTIVPVSDWDKAIFDAELMLEEAQDRVRRLAQAIKVFKRRRDSGEPFFGQEKEPDEAQS